MYTAPKRNDAIDIARIVTCLFVVFIHCPLPGVIGQLVIDIGRYGVPFFLLLSGWFSYSNSSSSEMMVDRARKKLLDTVKLIGKFLVAYIIMNSLTSLLSGKGAFAWVSKYTNVETLVNLLLYNRAVFFGSTGYYPFMLIYVYVAVIFLEKRGWLNYAFYLIPFLLAANVLLGEFTDIPWYWYGNFLFTGLPFFLLGHWIHMNESKLKKSGLFWVLVFLLGTVLALIEAFSIKAAYCYFGTVPMAVALLMLLMNSKFSVSNRKLIACLRSCSVGVFIIHCGVRDLLSQLFQQAGIGCSPYSFPWIVAAVSMGISVGWIMLYQRHTSK